MDKKLILASGSTIRKRLLKDAGVVFSTLKTSVDERRIQAELTSDRRKPEVIAEILAEAKATEVAGIYPKAIVIGCDQILLCDNEIFIKAADMTEASEQLQMLRGKIHHLLSAVVVVENGRTVWRHISSARLKMRKFTDRFLNDYLKCAGPGILSSVGCYHLEEEGIQLFSEIDGDYFSILGLPLLPLLGFLRNHGVIEQ